MIKMLLNRKYLRLKIILILLLGASFFFLIINKCHVSEKNYKILMIHSFKLDCAWINELNEGAKDGFHNQNMSVDIEHIYLNGDSLLNTQSNDTLCSLLDQKEKNKCPDLILVCDDQATTILLTSGHPLTFQIPIVFCGVDYFNYDLLNNHDNVTGFTTLPDFKRCYDLTEKLLGYRSCFYLFVEDSFLGQKALATYTEQIQYLADSTRLFPVNLFGVYVKNFMWVNYYSKSSFVVMPKWNMFYSGLSKVSNNPFMMVTNDGFGNGFLGGYFTTNYDQTYIAAETASEILRGKIPASKIPVRPSKQTPVFDWYQLKRWNIDKTLLPPGSKIANIPFLEKYKVPLLLSTITIFCLILIKILRLLWLYLNESKQKKKAQKKLLKKRNELDITMKSIQDAVILIDKELNICSINKAAMLFLGNEMDSNAYLGKNIYSVLDIRKPNDMHYLKTLIKEIRKGEKQNSIENSSYLSVGNRSFPVSGDIISIYNNEKDFWGILLTFKDKTEEYTQKKLLTLAIENENICLWRIDIHSRCAFYDITFFQKVDITDDGTHSISSKQFEELIHPDDLSIWLDIVSLLIENKKLNVSYQLRLRRPDKTYEWWEYRLTSFNMLADSTPLLLGVCFSIQSFKQTEEDLIVARNKALQSDKLKSAFLANMSHEIRTPLNAIVGFSNLLTGEDEYEENEKQLFIDTINNNCHLLLVLISDILDLSRIESGTMSFKETDCNLTELINQIITTQQVIIPDYLQLIKELPEYPVWIRIDSLRLNQVITNLINNAVKFTSAGSITVGYTIDEDQYIRIYVKDTGKGIPAQDMDKLFSRFYKKDEFAQGVGLGLSICKVIIDHFGGTINVTSEVGIGTCFTVRIPFYQCTTENLKQINNNMLETNLTTDCPEQITILVAEDEDSNYLLLKTVLRKYCNLIRAKNGLEAISLFKENKIDLILMDIKMPEMNGIDALKEIRTISDTVPVLMLSAYVYDSDKEAAFNAGCTEFLTKPIIPNVLKKTLANFLPGGKWE